MYELKLAYFAGLFDGEGSVTIAWQSPGCQGGRKRFVLRVSVEMTDAASLYQLQANFGGGKIYEVVKMQGRRTLYGWIVTSQNAKRFLLSIRQFVYVKGFQIDLALEFQRRVEAWRGRPMSAEEYACRLELRERLQQAKKLVVHGALNGIGANSGNGATPNPELTRRQSLKCVETLYPGQSSNDERQERVHSNEN